MLTELGDQIVALLDLGARDFALMSRIAQLLFQRTLTLHVCWERWHAWLCCYRMYPKSVRVEARELRNRRTPTRIQQPDITPRRFIGEQWKRRSGGRRNLATLWSLFGAGSFSCASLLKKARSAWSSDQDEVYLGVNFLTCSDRGDRLVDNDLVFLQGLAARWQTERCSCSFFCSSSVSWPEVETAQSSRNSSWGSVRDNAPAPRFGRTLLSYCCVA